MNKEYLNELKDTLKSVGRDKMIDLEILDCVSYIGDLNVEDTLKWFNLIKFTYDNDEQNIQIACYVDAYKDYLEENHKTIDDLGKLHKYELLDIVYERWL